MLKLRQVGFEPRPSDLRPYTSACSNSKGFRPPSVLRINGRSRRASVPVVLEGQR
jgi:hypothetical protein